MSWHFSQGLVADYLQAACSGGARCAQSSSTSTVATFYRSDRQTPSVTLSRSGTTLEPSTACDGEAVLTWYLEAFPARRIPRRLEVATSRMISGRKCGESWQRQL